MIEMLDDLATALEEVSRATAGDVVEYTRRGRFFAARSGDAVELRLPPDLAEAASRTPGTAMSSRGSEWIRFAPAEWNDHALDRLDAWFRVAWRMAGE